MMMKGVMTPLLYICTIVIAHDVCVESQIFITAHVGSTVVLPCKLTRVSSHNPHVQWSTSFETVFERKGEDLYEAEEYKGRVDVPEDKLAQGNCSLVIKKIKPSDEGDYESYMSVKHMERSVSTKWVFLQSVKLRVDETPVPPEETPKEYTYNIYSVADAAGRNCSYTLINFFSILLSSLTQFCC